VDGADGARKAVREQVMYGADWIKYYSDRRYHCETDGVLHSMVNFTDEEAKAIVDEAHRLGKKVAAHAIGSDGISAALRAGVDTIEHGDGLTSHKWRRWQSAASIGFPRLSSARMSLPAAAVTGQKWWISKKLHFRKRSRRV